MKSEQSQAQKYIFARLIINLISIDRALVLDFNNHTLCYTEANYLVITNQVSEPLRLLNDCHI